MKQDIWGYGQKGMNGICFIFMSIFSHIQGILSHKGQLILLNQIHKLYRVFRYDYNTLHYYKIFLLWLKCFSVVLY